MSAETMKLELIQWLTQMDDKGLLASLLQFKKANEAADWYDTLSPEQQAAIAEGEADIAAGRVRSSAEVWKNYSRSPKG